MSLTNLVAQMKDLYSSDIRSKYNDLLNSDEINETSKGVEDLKNKINSKDDELDRLEENIRKDYSYLNESQINKIIRDESKNINREKNTLINQYKAKLGTYQSLKENARLELDFFKYEDAQNKQVYTTALGMYETRRKEMRVDEQANFLAENKRLAEEEEFNRKKELIEFQAGLVKEKKTGGKYIDNGKGDLSYVVE